MFRRNRPMYSLVIALVLIALVAVSAQAQKRRPRSVSSAPPFLELTASRSTVNVCAGELSTVQLVAQWITRRHRRWSSGR